VVLRDAALNTSEPFPITSAASNPGIGTNGRIAPEVAYEGTTRTPGDTEADAVAGRAADRDLGGFSDSGYLDRAGRRVLKVRDSDTGQDVTGGELADWGRRSRDAIDPVTKRVRTGIETTATLGNGSTIGRLERIASLGGGLAPNPVFAQWPEGQPLPNGWTQVGNNPVRDPAYSQEGGIGMRYVVPAGMADTFPYTDIAGNQIRDFTHLYVEADFVYISGDLGGSGVHVQVYDSNGNYIGVDTNISFKTELPGAVPGQAYRVRRILKMPIVTGFTARPSWLRVHAMPQWGGFEQGAPGKEIVYLRIMVRPATDQEINTFETIDGPGRLGSGVIAQDDFAIDGNSAARHVEEIRGSHDEIVCFRVPYTTVPTVTAVLAAGFAPAAGKAFEIRAFPTTEYCRLRAVQTEGESRTWHTEYFGTTHDGYEEGGGVVLSFPADIAYTSLDAANGHATDYTLTYDIDTSFMPVGRQVTLTAQVLGGPDAQVWTPVAQQSWYSGNYAEQQSLIFNAALGPGYDVRLILDYNYTPTMVLSQKRMPATVTARTVTFQTIEPGAEVNLAIAPSSIIAICTEAP